MNDIQAPTFHPTMHQSSEPIVVLSVQVYHIVGVKLTELTQTHLIGIN